MLKNEVDHSSVLERFSAVRWETSPSATVISAIRETVGAGPHSSQLKQPENARLLQALRLRHVLPRGLPRPHLPFPTPSLPPPPLPPPTRLLHGSVHELALGQQARRLSVAGAPARSRVAVRPQAEAGRREAEFGGPAAPRAIAAVAPEHGGGD